LEHAGGLFRDPAVAVGGVACAAQVGECMKRGFFVCLLGLLLARSALAPVYSLTVAGLVGEPDYEKRFTTAATDLDKLLKTAGADVHVYTLTGGAATRTRLTEVLGQIARDARAEDDFVLILIG